MPVPVKETVRLVLLGAFDGMSSVAFLAPVDVGEKATWIVQVPPPATACPEQLSLDKVNWFAFVPVLESVPIVKLLPPVFVTVNVCAVEAPVFVSAYASLVGLTVMLAAVSAVMGFES
jgi:hypothetical protein